MLGFFFLYEFPEWETNNISKVCDGSLECSTKFTSSFMRTVARYVQLKIIDIGYNYTNQKVTERNPRNLQGLL